MEVQVNKKLVEHPNHYNKGNRKECWDEMEELFGVKATVSFCVLNAYKYLYRAGEKDGNSAAQDVEKAKTYIRKAINLRNANSGEKEVTDVLQLFANKQLVRWVENE